jgi:GMP reductase
MECADMAHSLGGLIIADGGITCPGDMAKAFCGGADFVMCGSVFAGHLENPGEMITENGKQYKLFYGMSSTHAMKKHYGAKASYRSSEGRVVKIPLKGSIRDTLDDYLGGLRSCCTYVNAPSIEDLMDRRSQFIIV